MRIRILIAAAATWILAGVIATSTGIAGEKIDFVPVPNFLKVPQHITLAQCSGVGVDSQGQVYLLHRGQQPILCFDARGKFLRSWGDDLIKSPHGLRIDRDDNVWVTDIGHHLVLKFNPKGKLLLALGQTDKPGLGIGQFDKPTDVAFGAKGEIYVADGYGNSRIVKFNRQGKFLTTWGRPGRSRGAFNTPHTIRVDSKGRVIVGDRENKRVQVFDADGMLLEIWPGFSPYGLAFDSNGVLFVADGVDHKILQLDTSGNVIGLWGRKGKAPGEFTLPHMLATDRANNLYVVEITGMRLQKLARQP